MKNLALSLVLFPLCISTTMAAETLKVSRPDGSTITAYLQLPPNSQAFTVLTVLQGSPCRSVKGAKNHPAIEKLGIARLDIEKPAIDENFDKEKTCKGAYLRKNNVFQRANDIVSVLNFIEMNFKWDGNAYLVGGSEGAVVAPIAAHRDTRVKGIGILAGAGGMSMADELKLIVQKGTSICDISSPEDFDPIFQKIFNSPDSIESWCGKTNSFAWWSKILLLKPADLMKELTIPMYVAHGTEDIATPVESSDLAVSVLREHGKDITYSRYEGLDHGWKDKNGESKVNLVIADLMKWLVGKVQTASD